MNTVTVKARTSFVHGVYTMVRGDLVEMPTPIADELEHAGLIDTVLKKVAKAPPAVPEKAVAQPDPKEPSPVVPDKPEPQKQEAAHANKMEKPATNKNK